MINPPAKNKRNYWTSDTMQVQQTDARQWLESAESVPGSWWPDWAGWLAGHSGRKVKAKATQGNAAYPPLAPARGSM